MMNPVSDTWLKYHKATENMGHIENWEKMTHSQGEIN